MIASGRSAHLFHLREENVEILVLAAFVFGQPSLHQTPETKSVMVHTHHTAAVRTFLVLVLGC